MARLAPGDTAPDFTLDDQDGAPVSLRDLRGRSVVVFFYPAAMTPGCTTEACDFRDGLAPLRAAGYEVLGISPDAPAKNRQFAEQEGLTYRLLSDPSRQVLEAYGAWGEKQLYGKAVTGVIRSTFVLDADGVVEVARYNVRATGHVAALTKQLGVAV